MLNRDFEFESLIKICVRTCEMNSTLGSVVPLAMFCKGNGKQYVSFVRHERWHN